MPSPSYIHQLSRRGTSVGPPIIAGTIAGALTLFTLLFIIWCCVRRRRLRAQRTKAEMKASEHSSFSSVPRKVSLTDKGTLSTYQEPNYLQIMMPLRAAPHPTIPASNERYRYKGSSFSPPPPPNLSSELIPKDNKSVLRKPRTNGVSDISSLSRPAPSLQREASLRRRNSVDSASVYSAASAPLDYHERILKNFSREDIPSSTPPWATSHSSPSEAAFREPRRTPPELTPEFYDKRRARGSPIPPQYLPIRGPAWGPSSIPPVPPLPQYLRPPSYYMPPPQYSVPSGPPALEYVQHPTHPLIAAVRTPPTPTHPHRHLLPLGASPDNMSTLSAASSSRSYFASSRSRSSSPPSSVTAPPLFIPRSSQPQSESQEAVTTTRSALPPELPTRSPLRKLSS